jgi:NADPH:quinone reductase-like Zn-dependent oxidoreductase
MHTDWSSDTIMAQTGAMVQSFPFGPGCDTGGIVVKTGPKAVNAMGREWHNGDRVFGCTRLGTPGHSAWGEYVGTSPEQK